MKIFNDYKRIVIKIGSSIITDSKKNAVNNKWLRSLCEDVKELVDSNKKIIIDSSGSVALGKKHISKKS